MSKVRTQVMASVAVIYAIRQLISPLALKAYGLAVTFGAVASMVSVGNVAANFLAVGLSGAGHFIVVALTNTAGLVQLALLAGAVFAVLILRDLLRSLNKPSVAFA